MSVNFDALTECPNCGLEFNKPKSNYNFCCYNCYRSFMDEQRNSVEMPIEVKRKWIVKNLIYSELWWRGYRPSLNWHRWDDDDEISDEFDRLLWRDE